MNKAERNFHQPVLLKEAVEALNVRRGKNYIDATIGGGGHAIEILKRGGRVLGIDWDPEVIDRLKKQIKKKNLILVTGNFKNLKKIAQKNGFYKVAGILFDLGLSSWQVEKSGRGFSYLKDEPLDMRINPSLKVRASDLINKLTKEELYEIFAKFGEEVDSWAIVNALVCSRPIRRTRELAGVIGKDVGRLARVFQALRMAVNDELGNLKKALPEAISLLEKKGRLVVLSFHSLEDRIVKFGFKTKNLRILTKKPIRPSKEELLANISARSARLRVAERI